VDDADRCRLQFGPYATPVFRYGDTVACLIRGEIEIVGLTEAPIPWPKGRAGRQRPLILYADLVRAVRRESAQAVARWWGVTPQTVGVWRKALGVGAVNEGTSRLKSESALGPGVTAGRRKAHEQSRDAAQDSGRREKIRAAREGKTPPRHVIEAMARGRIAAAKRRREGE
jgi:hypothetical protein